MIAVNLLPWRQQCWQRRRRQSVVVIALLLLLISLVIAQQLWQTQRNLQRLRVQQQALQTELDTLAERLTQQKQLMVQLALQQKRWDRQQHQAKQLADWQQFWLDLPALLPDSLWLKRLEKRDLQLVLEGEAQNMQAIADFRQRLAAQALFSKIQQGAVRRQPEGDYRFALRIQLQESADE